MIISSSMLVYSSVISPNCLGFILSQINMSGTTTLKQKRVLLVVCMVSKPTKFCYAASGEVWASWIR